MSITNVFNLCMEEFRVQTYGKYQCLCYASVVPIKLRNTTAMLVPSNLKECQLNEFKSWMLMLILFSPPWSVTPMEEHDRRTKCCGEFLELRDRSGWKLCNKQLHNPYSWKIYVRSRFVMVSWLNISDSNAYGKINFTFLARQGISWPHQQLQNLQEKLFTTEFSTFAPSTSG